MTSTPNSLPDAVATLQAELAAERLARREAEREGAVRAYGKLAEGGLRRLAPGGILVSASCSAHVSAEEFWEAVRGAARRSGRKWRELRTSRHAPDHHASFSEAEYLKAIFLQLEA